MFSSHNLARMTASRICHDLINPLGAISSGVELLAMYQTTHTEEMQLLNDAIRNATAKIKFLRIAYGMAGASAVLSTNDTHHILDDYYKDTRFTVRFLLTQACPRMALQYLFLGLQCLEVALPTGGQITITKSSDSWNLLAEGKKVTDLSDFSHQQPSIRPEHIQFPIFESLTGYPITQFMHAKENNLLLALPYQILETKVGAYDETNTA